MAEETKRNLGPDRAEQNDGDIEDESSDQGCQVDFANTLPDGARFADPDHGGANRKTDDHTQGGPAVG